MFAISPINEFLVVYGDITVSQITMTTAWLLLLLLIVSSQSVDSQLTTDDQVCDGEHLSDMKRDIERLLDNQQRLFRRLGKLKPSI